MILSDLGAEVIKIEKTDTGDETRVWTCSRKGMNP
jgi:crotonobetainyl-CoA:carnitine CoA-transferase CaiB-like acyl-CoA transferase